MLPADPPRGVHGDGGLAHGHAQQVRLHLVVGDDRDAQAAGALPVFALYGIPHRDCGSFAAGGFASAGDYKGWIDGIASDLGSAPAAVIVEPDALAMADCLSGDQRQERFDLMRYAVDTLTANPATALYVDAGHSRWVSAEDMAGRLNDVGVVAVLPVGTTWRTTYVPNGMVKMYLPLASVVVFSSKESSWPLLLKSR